MATKIFVNLPVEDLQRSIDFFTKLGYTFNQQFTNEQATCMVINEHIYVMLLVRSFFQTFTEKEIIDARKSVEVSLCLTADSREEVDAMLDKAIAAGAVTHPATDHGFMYQRSFEDMDGHHWEVFWMDPAHVQQQS